MVIAIAIAMTGCWDGLKRSAINSAEEYADSKLIELNGKEATREIAWAIKHQFLETDVDPNLDGTINWEEYTDWQSRKQAYVMNGAVKIATEGFASGETIESIKSKIESEYGTLWESLGGSSLITLLGMWLLNKRRNKTREDKVVLKTDTSVNT